MSRLLAAVSLPTILLAVGHAAPAPKGLTEKPYLPTTKGAVRVYQRVTTIRAGLRHKSEVTEVVTAVSRTAAGLIVTVSHREEGNDFAGSNTFLVSDAGLFTTGSSMTGPIIDGERRWTIDPPACLLRLPHKDGTTWEYNVSAQDGGLVGAKAANTARALEEVVVPAGTFKAIRVEQRDGTNGQETTATFWYAPDVGLVKLAYEGVVQELKSFTPGK